MFDNKKKILKFKHSVLPCFAINLVVSLGVASFLNVDMVHCFEVDNSLSNTEISDNYVDFWAKEAEKLDWFQKWTITEENGFPFVRWFKNGKLNVCYNCVDRHVKAGLGNKVAFYWENERGAKKSGHITTF